MVNVKCIKDNEGYWTEGEIYQAETELGGFLRIGDDDDKNADWCLVPVSYDENEKATYSLAGLDAEFVDL